MFHCLVVEEGFSSVSCSQNGTILNENEVTLRVDVISNICWKTQLPQ